MLSLLGASQGQTLPPLVRCEVGAVRREGGGGRFPGLYFVR